MKKLPTIAKLALFLLLSGLGSAAPGLHAEVVNIDNDRLRTLIESGVTVIDVRRPDEWKSTGVLEQSALLTFFDAKGQYDAPAWVTELDKIAASGDPVILICRSGNRTSRISQWLSEDVGYETVYNVTDGIRSWLAEGGATVQP